MSICGMLPAPAGNQDLRFGVVTEADHMSSFFTRAAGSLSLLLVSLSQAGAEVVPQDQVATAAVFPLPPEATPATKVRSRLLHLLPGEAIQVRTANGGLVLSGVIANPENLHRALALAEEHAPGRVSNLMTVGRPPQIELRLQLAELPRAVARNLSASMGMAGMFAPSSPGEAGALPGLIAALEAKGVLRPIASAHLTATAGRVMHLPAGSGCTGDTATGIGMDVTPSLAEDGAIAVTLRTCLPGKAPGEGDSTVTILLQDGQTFALADVLPDLLRDPTAYSSALAEEPTLAPLLSSTDYREGRTEVMILITARISDHAPALSADGPRLPTGTGAVPVSEPAAGATGAFTLSHPLLK